MKWTLYKILFFFTIAIPAHAYIPPAHYIVKKIVAERDSTKDLIIRTAIYKPDDSSKAESPRTGDELFVDQIAYGGIASSWPVWQIFYSSDADELKSAIMKFGIKFLSEQELTRYRNDQLVKLSEMPSSFYKRDESTSMKRFANTVVWQISNKEKTKHILVEKDTFLPLSIVGPCPEDLGSTCSVDFPRGRKEPKIYFRKDKNILFIVKVLSKEPSPPELELSNSTHKDLFTTIFK